MSFLDVKLEGKVKSLVDEFEKTEAFDQYGFELNNLVQKLQMHKWDIYLTKLKSRVGFWLDHGEGVDNITWEDVETIKSLALDRADQLPAPNLTENEKIDRILEFFQDGWFEMDLKTLQEVGEKVKSQSYIAPENH